MTTKYSFENICSPSRLSAEIITAGIITALDHIDVSGNTTDLWFVNELSLEEQIKLNYTFDRHTRVPDKVVITDGGNNEINQLDIDNAQIVRMKAAKKGWSFWSLPPELTTSKVGGDLYCKDVNGVDIAGVTCKIYNAQNEEITTPGLANINLLSCVKTVLDIECPFDVELIGGSLRIHSNPGSDLRLWIIGAPDIPPQMGGSKEFSSGINLKFLAPDNSFEIDGRVTKYITYHPTLHTGKIRIVFKHGAGLTVNMQCVIHLYRL